MIGPLHNSVPSRTPIPMSTADGLNDIHDLFKTHGPALVRFLRYLGVGDSDRDDALQEVFLVVHRRMHELPEIEKVSAWLRAIAYNVARNWRRSRKRERAKSTVDIATTELASPSTGPEESLERTRARERLITLLTQLSEDQRSVIVLFEIEQLPMRQVAEIVGCPLQTAYSRLHSAKIALRRAWEEGSYVSR